MMKVKAENLRYSGTLRSVNGAKAFYRIIGHISTARKNSLSVIDVIQAAFEVNPFIAIPTES